MKERVGEIIRWLEKHGSAKNRDGMARYGIVSAHRVHGVSVGELRTLSKRYGRDHGLALGLWATPHYETRMLAAFVDDPALVAASQMDRWARDFDNWAICDTVCFHLFDKAAQRWTKVDQWSVKKAEFVKRAAFALLASIALHDKREADEPFLRTLSLIEHAASDDRNFVKKGVSWALRGVGRRSRTLNDASVALAKRLVESDDASARWVGRDALRERRANLGARELASRASRRSSHDS